VAYYTAAGLREQAGGMTASAARAELSHAATTPSASYDIFLSHSIKDEVLVLGLRNALRNLGMTVYVDWLDDPTLDRARVTPTTAVTLRQRMRSSRVMVYATSSNAAASRWMPWELGYFDGRREQSKVAICPIITGAGSIQGQEYLGIYKRVEPLEDNGVVFPYVLKPSGTEGESVHSFVHGRDEFRRVIRRD
jgi:hypothetical protein